MRTKLFAGVAFAALSMPAAAFAQSSGSIEVDASEPEIIVTGTTTRGVEGMVVPDAPKARQVLTNEALLREGAGNTVLDALNIIPGVNFTQSDAYGSSGGNIRIRGFDGNRVSLTFDGFPLNDSGNYAIYSNQQLDPEVIDEVNVNLGTTDVDSPTASAAGGTINYRTIIPSREPSATLAASAGDFEFFRVFGLVETGELTSFGTRLFASASKASNAKFKGPGEIDKQQYNAGIYQPIGSNGDFVRLSGHYNQNRNAFYRNPSVGDMRTLYGVAVIKNNLTASAERPIVVGNFSKVQEGQLMSFENEAFCRRPTPGPGAQSDGAGAAAACSNFYALRINPSNTGNVRFNSRFTLAEQLILTADASYQYTLANGGGTTNLAENSARARGGVAGSPGVDFNGDGDFLDTVRFYTPNITNTNRWTAMTSLIYNISDQHRVRIAYTFDRANHRQTGEWGYISQAGFPESPFSGRDARPVLNAANFQIQQRDRKSVALLNQVSAEYVGKFLDDALTIQLGVRAPFFQRDLDTRCPIQARDGFAYCTTENIVTLAPGQPVPASGYYYVQPGQSFAASGGAVPLYRPYTAKYKYDAILPNVGFVYKFGGDFNVFGSYAKGFSAPRTDNLYRSPFVDVKPETTNAFDLGVRMTNREVQAQVTAWYIGYKNRIVTSFNADEGISVDRNVGSVKSYGADMSITVAPFDWVALTGMASYTFAELQDNIQLLAPPAPPAQTKGKRVAETPEWQLGGRAQFEFGPVEFGVEGKWVDDRFATDVNDVVVANYALVDLDARLSLADFGLEKTYIQMNVKNLFDTFYLGNISTQIDATGNPNFSVGYPRTFSAGFHIEF